MKFRINKNNFVNNLLNPVSKLADNLLLDFKETADKKIKAKALVSSADNSVVFLGESDCSVEAPSTCIIPDCKTFLRLFTNIQNDNVELTINSNSISYKSSSDFSFKYHLLDESYIVNKKSINEEKLNELTFDVNFTITKQKLSDIIKFNSIVPDAEKLYFFTDKNKVFVKLGDEQKPNTNEIVTEIASSYSGKEIQQPIPLNIQNILLFSFGSADIINININETLKVFKFSSDGLVYIISGLVK